MISFTKPSKRKFATQLIAAIQQINSEAQFVYDASEFRLLRQDAEGEANLHNMYREHCSLPKSDRPQHLQRLASVFATPNDLPEDFEEARSHLRPKLWARSTFEFLELRQQLEGRGNFNVPLYPLGSHLYSSIVYDTEASMRSLSNENLEKWGVSYYEALEIACRNLAEATVAFGQIGEGLYTSMSGDNYDSARILLADRLRGFEVSGEHIAVAPMRDAMFMAGSDDIESLRILFELTQKATTEESRPLCPLPLKLEEDGWVDWIPPKNHVLRERFDDLELHFLGELYEEQKGLLEQLLGEDEHAPFVASFSGIKKEGTDQIRSYCVWSRGVDSLLPKAQLVMFLSDERMVAAGELDHVKSIVGDLMVEDDSYYPVRYRAREFPSDEQLEQIGNVVTVNDSDEGS